MGKLRDALRSAPVKDAREYRTLRTEFENAVNDEWTDEKQARLTALDRALSTGVKREAERRFG